MGDAAAALEHCSAPWLVHAQDFVQGFWSPTQAGDPEQSLGQQSDVAACVCLPQHVQDRPDVLQMCVLTLIPGCWPLGVHMPPEIICAG